MKPNVRSLWRKFWSLIAATGALLLLLDLVREIDRGVLSIPSESTPVVVSWSESPWLFVLGVAFLLVAVLGAIEIARQLMDT